MKTPLRTLFLVLSASVTIDVASADGIPVDRTTHKVTVAHTMLTIDDSQREEIETLGTLTLTAGQWQTLRLIGPSCPKRIDTILPVTWSDCTCDMVLYAIQTAPNKVAVPHGMISDPYLKEALGYAKGHTEGGYLLSTSLHADRRGQFYDNGHLIPFNDLLEFVAIAKRPRCNRSVQTPEIGVELPLGITPESPVVKSRLEKISKVAEKACITLPYDNSGGAGQSLPWDGEVFAIREFAFANCVTPKNITLPDSISSIEKYAFNNCKSLESINIPASTSNIESRVFAGCSSLKTVTLHEGIKKIGEGAFSECALLDQVVLPDSLTDIGEHAFSDCATIHTMTLPNSVTHIGSGMFAGCASLETMTIPGTVKSFDSAGTFHRCSALKTVRIEAKPQTIGDHMFLGCHALREIRIPDSVTDVGRSAFHGCSSLESITLPDAVTRIGQYAFEDCTSLKSITIPNSVTELGEEAFHGCESLETVSLSNSMTKVGKLTFAGCAALKSIAIPASVAEIDDKAFINCPSLKTITLASRNTRIHPQAFDDSATKKMVFTDGVDGGH